MGNKKTWVTLKQSVSPDALDMYIYDYVQSGYYDWWTDEYVESETSANYFKEELAKYPDAKSINLYVNSNGGDVMEAMAIRNQLKRHPAHKTGYVDGFACSAASFILTACDKVVMYSNTMQMLHLMWMVTAGNYKELRKTSEDLEQISIGNRQAYLEKANGKMTEEQVIEILESESWLTAQKCLELGLADEIIAEEKDLTKAQEIAQRVNKSLEQQISYNKALVAMVKELKQEDPKPKAPEPEKQNVSQKLFLSIFK